MNQGIVLYCDGGARPTNPGFAGWGLHGYLYDNEKPKKPVANIDQLVTSIGYISKTDLGESREYLDVTPIHYIDGYGSIPGMNTNNVAELHAAINGINHALEYDVREVKIFTDSEYTCKGYTSYARTWRQNNWMRSNGVAVLNIGLWKELLDVADRLIARNCKLTIEWVKGHVQKDKDGGKHPYCLGNVIADKLATIGVLNAMDSTFRTVIETTLATGYWKYEITKHPFIANRRLYFNTLSDYLRPGEYFLGEHGKDDDMFGKRISDGAYSVVILKEPDPLIELIRNYQSDLANNLDAIMMLRLDQLYKSDIHKEITKFDKYALVRPNSRRLDLTCLDKEPLTREFNPPKLAIRAVESVNDLANKLQMFINNDPLITTTDITEVIYDTEVKTSKKGIETTSMSIKPEFNVGFASINVMANYNAKNIMEQTKITLTLGIDLVDRNTLKRLESLNPKISLITWSDSPDMFKYAVVMQIEEDIGIWCGYYSNTHYTSNAE